MATFNYKDQSLTKSDIEAFKTALYECNMDGMVSAVKKIKPCELEHQTNGVTPTIVYSTEHTNGDGTLGMFDCLFGHLKITIGVVKALIEDDDSSDRKFVSWTINYAYNHPFRGGSNGKRFRFDIVNDDLTQTYA